MTDTSTIIAYILLLLTMVVTTSFIPQRKVITGSENNIKYPLLQYIGACALPILIYTLFWGLRADNVGTDYIRYIDHYEYAWYDLQMEEFGDYTFMLLCYGLSCLGFGYVSMFLATSFINILSVYVSSWDKGKNVVILSVFFYFCTSSVFFAQNGIRQAMASSILLMGLSLIENRKYIAWIICAIAAFFTHHSSILFALYVTFIACYKPFRINTIILTAVYVLMEFMGVALQNALFDNQYSLAIAAILGYEENIMMALDELGEGATYNSGLGIILRMFLNIVLIYFGNKKLKIDDKSNFNILFYVYYLGIIFERLFEGNMMLNRLAVLFSFAAFPAIAHIVDYMIQISRRNKLYIILVIGVILGFFLKYYMGCKIGSNGTGFYHMINF